MKEESEKAGLKFNNQKTKIITSGPIISWHIDVEKSGSSDKLYFLGLQNHLDSDCSQEIKTHLLLGRKTMINLDSILKIRDITLLTKVHIVKAIVFPEVLYGCESWIIKKAEPEKLMLANCGARKDS